MDLSMEDSVFDDGGSSDNFSPVKAKPKAAAKTAPKKAAAGPKATTKAPKKATQTTRAKPAASKKRPAVQSENNDSDADLGVGPNDDSLLSATPPSAKKQKKSHASAKSGGKPLQELSNEAVAFDGASEPKPKKGSASTEQYQKLTQLEHIIKRPDTYIGSVERTEKQMWVYNTQLDSMEMRDISYVPGLYKIFDEILVNAADNKQRDNNMDTIKVTIDREKGEISVWNNGRGIPIEIHEKEKIYIPEMIFGHLLTSSNYDDEEQKVTGGRNGYGAKLCNIFSTKFTLETADGKTKKKYKQTWTDNMSHMGSASITANKGDNYTMVTFTPDFKKFKMTGMDEDFEALVKRRVYDLAGTSRGVKLFLNGERVKINSFKKYMEMYTKAIKRERGDEVGDGTTEIITDSPDIRWEVGFTVSDGTFQQVSFVNSIATTSGGTHVNYVADQVCTRLWEFVKKKNKGGAALKLAQIRNHIFLFVNCLIVNPAFTSQTKEQLTTKQNKFGSKCDLSEAFLSKITKTEVISNILHFAQQKADQLLKKSDGNRRSRMDNPKLTDANKAGTKDGYQCTLILTEGDSAKGMAMAGRAVVGPDLFGVFPLRGKLLNVRDASVDQVSKNAEIQNIKNILGLKHKTEYTDCKSLRYGHIMIMTDQDHDGSHIKGLLINFLQVSFPSLLRIPEFLIEFVTPIVKVYKGDPKQPSKSVSFFSMPEYEAWKEAHQHERGWEHKYYKGLGTSSTEEAQVYFHDLDKHLKEFHVMETNEPELIELAFSKKKADERKEWLRQFKPGTFLDHSIREITYTDFVNKELILFSMADNLRSIPSVVDGLKPGQRKVLYACFKRNIRKDIKVVELAGHVSGLTAYQHGDASLQQTIVGLAQTFVGSNNINCLEPSGNFGSRFQGGSDAASPRYIYTRLSPFARRVFHAVDEPLLKYNTDDDSLIEPEMYVPVVPMILINGADGIGTGWSSSIPNYNPEDVVENLRLMMDDQPLKPMTPWFRDFKGTVTAVAPDRFKFSGTIRQTSDTEVEITELPIRTWTQDYKDKMVEIIKAEKVPSWIKDYDDYNTHKQVHFVIRLEEKHMKSALEEGLEEKFKLSKTIATSNLVAFDPEGRITKYATVEDILKEFYTVRLKLYARRHAYQLEEIHKELTKLSNQARFIQMIIDGKLVVSKKKKQELVAELKQKGFKPIAKVADASKDGDFEPAVQSPEGDEDDNVGAGAYDYLLGMPIWSLTKERVEKLLKQMGDKELEVDEHLKLTKEDLWKRDLEDFINEWRFQIADEEKRQRKVANLGRRVSTKLKTQVKPSAKRRRAGNDDASDSEFEAVRPKKAAVVKHVKPQGGLLSHISSQPKANKAGGDTKTAMSGLKASSSSSKTATADVTKPSASDSPDIRMTVDGAEDEATLEQAPAVAPIFQKAKAAAKKPATTKSKKAAEKDNDSADESNARPAAAAAAAAAGRKPRAAASKPVKYAVLTDSDSDGADNGDDMLLDVGKMVRGLPAASSSDPSATGGATAGTTATSARPLFSALSRPGSSAGLAAAAARKSLGARPQPNGGDDDDEADETDYTRLAPRPTSNGAAKTTARATLLSDDEDDDDDNIYGNGRKAIGSKIADVSDDDEAFPPPAPATKAKKAAAVPKPKAKPAKPAAAKPAPAEKPKATEPKKKAPLSPAAKAYAAKQSRVESSVVGAKVKSAKISSSKAASSKKRVIDLDDEDEDEDEVAKMADELMSDDDDEDLHLDNDNDIDDADEDEDEDVFAPQPKRKTAPAPKAKVKATSARVDAGVDAAGATGASTTASGARPARRAAATKAVEQRKAWVLSDEDEDEDGEDGEDEEDGGEEVDGEDDEDEEGGTGLYDEDESE